MQQFLVILAFHLLTYLSFKPAICQTFCDIDYYSLIFGAQNVQAYSYVHFISTLVLISYSYLWWFYFAVSMLPANLFAFDREFCVCVQYNDSVGSENKLFALASTVASGALLPSL